MPGWLSTILIWLGVASAGACFSFFMACVFALVYDRIEYKRWANREDIKAWWRDDYDGRY